MLNKYFKASRDNLDFVFLNAVLKNIDFALISLDYIFNHSDFDCAIYHDKHTFYFFHIQSILTACGNIHNVFFNKFHKSYKTPCNKTTEIFQKEISDRCQRLCSLLDVSKEKYPLIFQKEVRNTNEHFDERYNQIGELGDYNLLDKNTDSFVHDVIIDNTHLRTYDIEFGVYYTYGWKMNRISYDLHQLRGELIELRARIESQPEFTSAWEE